MISNFVKFVKDHFSIDLPEDVPLSCLLAIDDELAFVYPNELNASEIDNIRLSLQSIIDNHLPS